MITPVLSLMAVKMRIIQLGNLSLDVSANLTVLSLDDRRFVYYREPLH
jgi:hypothetical protein